MGVETVVFSKNPTYPYQEIYDGMDLIVESDYVKGFIKRYQNRDVHRCYSVIDFVHDYFSTRQLSKIDISFDVKYQIPMKSNSDWISFLTLKCANNSQWSRVVTFNVNYTGELIIYHAPDPYSRSGYTRPASLLLPRNDWWRFRAVVDCTNKTVEVYQDGTLVESNTVNDSFLIYGFHAGFYTNGQCETGYVANKDITVIGTTSP